MARTWADTGRLANGPRNADPPKRNWPQHDYPASYSLDRTLAGRDEPLPAALYRASPPAPGTPPGQIYAAPHRADIRRDRGAAQVIKKARAEHPVLVQQDAAEVPAEKNPPFHRQAGFRVVRDRGSAQIQPVPVDLGVVGLLGARHFAADGPDTAAGPICGFCLKPMQISTRHGTEQRKYCSRDHKEKAAKARAKASAAD